MDFGARGVACQALVPESLNDLSPEERHQIYKMLRLEVLAYPDKSLEVSGTRSSVTEMLARWGLAEHHPVQDWYIQANTRCVSLKTSSRPVSALVPC
jgi:hypothetical protein